MGSKSFEGVWFTSYSRDHSPPHVHGRYAGVQLIVDLLPGGKVRQASRWNAVTPRKAKKSDVRHILATAAQNAAELTELWKRAHGEAS